MKNNLTVIALVSILVMLPNLFGEDGDAKEQKRTVYALDNSSSGPSAYIPIPGDWGRITRLPDRIRIEVRLSGLDPEQVYNAHAWIFNNPAACMGSPGAHARGSACSALVDQHIPETLPSAVSFGGFIPDRSGNLHMELELRIGEGFPVVSLFETNGSFISIVQARGPLAIGLTDPMNADIGLNLARKGPVQPDNTELQFKTVFGACGDDFTLPPLDPDQLCEVVRNSPVGGTL
jgi:hypothetical protein